MLVPALTGDKCACLIMLQIQGPSAGVAFQSMVLNCLAAAYHSLEAYVCAASELVSSMSMLMQTIITICSPANEEEGALN